MRGSAVAWRLLAVSLLTTQGCSCSPTVRAFVADGDHLVVFEATSFDGEEHSRLVRLAATNGAEVASKSLAFNGEALIGLGNGTLWLRSESGLVTRSPTTLEVVEDEAALRSRIPELGVFKTDPVAETTGTRPRGCFDVPTKTFRFPAPDGRFVGVSFDSGQLVPVDSVGCMARNATDVRAETPAGPLVFERLPQSQRQQVVNQAREALGVSGLELAFLQLPAGALGGDVLVKRTSELGEAGTTQLVRLDVGARREAWSTELVRRRSDIEDAALIGSNVVLIAGVRLLAIDPTTGAVRWSRGKSD